MLFPITFISDLHVDYQKSNFMQKFLNAYENFSGYLIIAGDFCNNVTHPIFETYFSKLFQLNKKITVFFIAGNHDFYGTSVEQGTQFLKALEEKYRQFIYLDEKLPIFYSKNILIYGSTLWYSNHPDIYLLQDRINDFTQIKNFNPQQAVDRNTETKDWLKSTKLSSPESNCLKIFVSHHSFSNQSIAPQYKGDRLNCYFVDPDAEKYIAGRFDLAIHGHMHDAVNYDLNGTRVLSNPVDYYNQDYDGFLRHIIWVNT